MKQFYLYTKRTFTMAAAAIVLMNTSLKAQTVPELVFQNGTKVGTATAGADGAVYWFKSVATGIDAMVKINGRSSSNVVLNTLDLSTTGFENSFQPVINYTGGTNYNNNTTTQWYMEFKIYFVKSSDTSQAVSVTGFNATALDVDGNSTLHERDAFYGLNSYVLETGSTLTVTSSTAEGIPGKQFESGSTEFSGISTTATQAMVTASYINTSSFYLRLGGWAKGPINIDNGGRQYSIWFKSFTYTTPVSTPVNGSLPVDLISFTTNLNSAKAAVLDWTTSNEVDFSNFVVQRSTDGSSFNDVSMIFSNESDTANVKTYTYTDNAATQNTIDYYRLKMVNMDGSFTYSEVTMVRESSDQQQASILIYPNPVVSDLRVTIPDSWQGKNVSYTVFNSNGNVIRQKVSSQANQTETLSVSGTPAGMYMIRVIQGTETTTKQFVKQN